jgi:NAD-dependent deacetylase
MNGVRILEEKLKTANRVAVITGAGISQESGIPTFRGEGGLWKNYRAEDLATPEAFARDPKLVWEWYEWRKKICFEANPNPAHSSIAEWEQKVPEFHLFTQNVDGLHKRAGSKQFTCIHGEIFSARCTKCSYLNRDTPVVWDNVPPVCPNCKSMLRPHIVWFGETYFPGHLEFAFEFLEKADLLVVIGTSGSIGVPVQLAKYAQSQGAYTVEINPDPGGFSSFMDLVIQGKAGEVLPKVKLG